MDSKHLIAIEKGLLSSLFFDSSLIEELIIKENDFYLPIHSEVYKTILKLHDENLPIDEEFINTRVDKNIVRDNDIIEILSATPISNATSYEQEILKESEKRATLQIIQDIRKASIDDENFNKEKLDQLLEIALKQQITRSYLDRTRSVQEIIEKNIPILPKLVTGIDFFDDIFKTDNESGGLELGHVITLTGEQEAGKTRLAEQILFNISDIRETLYFALEFSEFSLQQSLKRKTKKYNINKLRAVTLDDTDGSINDIINIIKQSKKKHGTKLVVIDSAMMLYDDSSKYTTAEEQITNIYRKLHAVVIKEQMSIIIISQSSKNDNNSDKVEIFGSKKAAHLAYIMLHIKYDRNEDTRTLVVAKNKQNGKHSKVELKLNNDLEFEDNSIIEYKEDFAEDTKKINNLDGLPLDNDDWEESLKSKEEKEVINTVWDGKMDNDW